MDPYTDLFRAIGQFLEARYPQATAPTDVMIVTSVNATAKTAQCKHQGNSFSDGYAYRYLTATAPAVGNRVLIRRLKTGPIIDAVL